MPDPQVLVPSPPHKASRTVVVTGGASGIGAAVTRRFLAAGDTVVVADLKASEDADTVIIDLSEESSIDDAVSRLPTSIDVLCNVAGVSGASPVPLVFAVNFLGLRRLTEAVAPTMPPGGSVVCVASSAGWYWRKHLEQVDELLASTGFTDGMRVAEATTSGYEAYVRSKEAVIVWVSHAAQRYRGQLRVNSVSPGPVNTPLLPAFYQSMGATELDPLVELAGGRHGEPAEIAEAVYFLASPAASWINGTDLVVDGGAEMAFALRQHCA